MRWLECLGIETVRIGSLPFVITLATVAMAFAQDRGFVEDAPQVASEKTSPLSLDDYLVFWGVDGTTPADEIIRRFGPPERTYGTRWFYFKDTLSFFIDDDHTVRTILISSTENNTVPEGKIPAEILHKTFLGRKANDVLTTFGDPDSLIADNYTYYGNMDGHLLIFVCYEFHEHTCTDFWLFFPS